MSLSASLLGCGGGSIISNPFSKAEEKLPGERVAVITTSDELASGANASGAPASLPTPITNGAWAQPGGVPSNNAGHLTAPDSLNQVWTAAAGTGSSSRARLITVPLVHDGKVYTLDTAATVSAFSAGNGAKLWSTGLTPKHERSAAGYGGGLAIDGGRLYAVTGHGVAASLNPANGAVEWTQTIGQPVRSSPTAANGRLLFVATDSVLYCLNGADGTTAWTARGLPQPAAFINNVSPAVSGNTVVAAFPAGEISAYRLDSGQPMWTDSLARGGDTSALGALADPARPVIDQGMVFAVSHSGRMIAAAESTGARLWTRNIASTQMPWVAGDSVYVVDVSGRLVALSRKDGNVRWTVELPGSKRWSGPVLAGGRAWVVSAEGTLVGVDARTGQAISNVPIGTAVFITPVVAGGRMYILADNARLVALN
jgi:outer membrane protein assembly factor BamB